MLPINTAYRYSQWYLEKQVENYRSIDTKASALLGLSAVLLKFSSQMPIDALACSNYTDKICLSLKILVCTLNVIYIVFCTASIFINRKTKIMHPGEKIDYNFLAENEECYQVSIINSWSKTSQEIELHQHKKKKWLSWTVLSFSLSTIIYGLDVIVCPWK